MTVRSSNWIYFSPLGAGFLRAVVATPLDAVATREILHHRNTYQVIKSMEARDFLTGFQPNVLKFLTRTPAQFAFVKVASWSVPTDWGPGVRGFWIGVVSSGMETGLLNSWNALRTRFIQKEDWSVLRTEGFSVLKNGLTSALIHRSLSGAIFWTVYEKLKHQHPSQGALVSTVSGVVQVFLTSPFFIAAIYRQRKGAPREYLHHTMGHLAKTRNVSSLFFTALVPRLVHSGITSAPLMWLMEKLQLVHR